MSHGSLRERATISMPSERGPAGSSTGTTRMQFLVVAAGIAAAATGFSGPDHAAAQVSIPSLARGVTGFDWVIAEATGPLKGVIDVTDSGAKPGLTLDIVLPPSVTIEIRPGEVIVAHGVRLKERFHATYISVEPPYAERLPVPDVIDELGA